MPFLKKNFFLIWSVKSNFQWGGIRSTPIVLDHPRALLSKKVGLLLSLFSRKISFLNKWSRNFSYFLFEIFYHIHLFYKGWDIRCICCKCEHWSWKQEINRYAYNVLRGFLWNNWLQMKLVYKSKLPLFHVFRGWHIIWYF